MILLIDSNQPRSIVGPDGVRAPSALALKGYRAVLWSGNSRWDYGWVRKRYSETTSLYRTVELLVLGSVAWGVVVTVQAIES